MRFYLGDPKQGVKKCNSLLFVANFSCYEKMILKGWLAKMNL